MQSIFILVRLFERGLWLVTKWEYLDFRRFPFRCKLSRILYWWCVQLICSVVHFRALFEVCICGNLLFCFLHLQSFGLIDWKQLWFASHCTIPIRHIGIIFQGQASFPIWVCHFAFGLSKFFLDVLLVDVGWISFETRCQGHCGLRYWSTDSTRRAVRTMRSVTVHTWLFTRCFPSNDPGRIEELYSRRHCRPWFEFVILLLVCPSFSWMFY